MPKYQKAFDSKLNRADHVWVGPDAEGRRKCCLCGAMTVSPPPCPTPADWLPELGYALLTEVERAACPMKLGRARS